MSLQELYGRAVGFQQMGNLAEAEKLFLQILSADPSSFAPRYMLGVICAQQNRNAEALDLIGDALKAQPNANIALVTYGNILCKLGRFEEALASYDRALAIMPNFAVALSNRGNALRGLNRLEEALASYDRSLAIKPDLAEALYNRGIALMELNRFLEALASCDKLLAIKPDFAEGLTNRGVALLNLKRFEEALACYDKALAIKPSYTEAIYNRGQALQNIKRFEEAVISYENALAIIPENFDALYNRGLALWELKRFPEALADFDKVLAIKPDFAMAWSDRGNALRDMKRPEEALESYEKALTIKPDFAEALNNRGVILGDLKRFEEALVSYDKALTIKPDYIEALYNRGVNLRDLKRFKEALASYEMALAIKPDLAEAINNYGTVLSSDPRRFEEALADYQNALTIDPDHLYVLEGVADAALHLCDWPRAAIIANKILTHDTTHKFIMRPFTLLGYSDDVSLQLQCAKNYILDKVRVSPYPLWDGTTYRHGKIQIAYLSSDFRLHPMTSVVTELFELHDRSRFNVLGISLGIDDNSDIRARLVKAVDRFIDARSQCDSDVAELLRKLEVDIVIDLNGYTKGARTEILSYRPAPVQVSYMGYPGTMGAHFIDYVIADKVVLPFERQRYFTEKIVHLPDCYWVNDSKRAVAEETPTRKDVDLPEDGFVFCCFNNSWKITAPVFDIWMRLLDKLEGSVLWLLCENPGACENLRREAVLRGVSPQRIVFAPKVRQAEHLARHRLADLFLDTLPYNAHTTTSDALWMGLPLITCRGGSFAGRVAASLLNAVGLPELVTESLEDYEALALRLALEPFLLQSLSHKLAINRVTYPLFDTNRFRHNIEAAYTRMWEIAERGEAPKSFSVQSEV